MKPEEQRIAIAEACGWKFDHRYKGSRQYSEIIVIIKDAETKGSFFPGDIKSERGRECMTDAGVPDYLKDLNAMHEAEGVLTEAQLMQYADLLYWDAPNNGLIRKAIRVTAAQRAEAFLRTLNLWTPRNE